MSEAQKKISIKGLELISWQKKAHEILKTHPKDHMLVIKAHRQVGKSYFIMMMLAEASLKNKNAVSYCVSPTFRQASKIYKELIELFSTTPVITKTNGADMSLTFVNGSEINFKSAEQGEGLRGFTCKNGGILCVDEAAYIKDEVFGNVLNYTNVNKNNVIVVSTPKFKTGFFYKLYSNPSENVSVIDVNDFDTSMFLNEDKKAFYRDTMPYTLYKSDILGLFLDAYSTVFGDFTSLCKNHFDMSSKYYIGVDWGSGSDKDYTVIVVMNEFKQMVELRYFNDKSVEETIKIIQELYNKYQPMKLTVEQNSIGKIYGDVLKSTIGKSKVKFFNTTNDTKNKIINQLQLAIQKHEIQLLDDVELKVQFSSYEVQITPTGKTTFNASKGAHDDIVMATAICLDSIIHKGNLDLVFI